MNSILRYFGESPALPCGNCDVCRAQNKARNSADHQKQLRESVLYLAAQPGGHPIAYIARETSSSEQEIVKIVRELMDENAVIFKDGNIIINPGQKG